MERIAIFVNTLKSGGAEKQSIYLLNALSIKYKVYLIVYHGKSIDDNILNLAESDNFELVKLHGATLSKLVKLYKVLKCNEVKYLFTYLTMANFFGSIIGRLSKVGNIYLGIRNSSLPFWKILLERVSNLLSTATVVNNERGRVIFAKFGFKRLLYIPNAFPNIASGKERPLNETVRIITVGRFVPQKDYLTSLKVIKKLSLNADSFIYEIVGYGKLEKWLRKRILDFGLEKYVELCINPKNIRELLDSADVYLATSKFEGTSNAIMEALNSSLPVVATDVGDNNFLIENGESGFLHAIGDVDAIHESLLYLISNHKMRQKFGKKGNLILKKSYSNERLKTSYFALLKRI